MQSHLMLARYAMLQADKAADSKRRIESRKTRFASASVGAGRAALLAALTIIVAAQQAVAALF